MYCVQVYVVCAGTCVRINDLNIPAGLSRGDGGSAVTGGP